MTTTASLTCQLYKEQNIYNIYIHNKAWIYKFK